MFIPIHLWFAPFPTKELHWIFKLDRAGSQKEGRTSIRHPGAVTPSLQTLDFFWTKNTKQNSKEWKFHAHPIVFFMDCHFVILCTWTPHLATIVTSHICHFVLKHQDTSHRQRPPAHQINGYLFFFHQISNTTVWFTHGRIMTRSFQKK